MTDSHYRVIFLHAPVVVPVMDPSDSPSKDSELIGPELSQEEISDIKAVFQSIVDSISLQYCCANILYANYQKFTAIIQRKHADDIIIQVSNPLTDQSERLRLRVELFARETRPGMTALDYIRPQDSVNDQPVRDTAARSVVLSVNHEYVNTTLRQLLVKIKSTLISQSRLAPADLPGGEGQSDYPLTDFDVIFVGEDSLWADEATPDTRRSRFPSPNDS